MKKKDENTDLVVGSVVSVSYTFIYFCQTEHYNEKLKKKKKIVQVHILISTRRTY